jgi:hypothetical protein
MRTGTSLAGLALAALATGQSMAQVDPRSARAVSQEPVFPTTTQLVTIDAVVLTARAGR